MYLGRVKQGQWIRLMQPKVSIGNEDDLFGGTVLAGYPIQEKPDWTGSETYVKGVNNPTVTVIDKDGTIVVDAKKMHLFDERVSSALFTSELFVGEDIPVGVCTVRTEYVSTWYIQANLPSTSSVKHNVYATISTIEVVPSGSSSGTYLSSFVYERPHASFLLGHYDNDELDYRRNPRD